jgi:fructose-bisphosphate aldolase class 1
MKKQGEPSARVEGVLAEAAQATRLCMQRSVPAAVPGIVFLSGGQSDVRATEHLDALNRKDPEHAPWQMSFSFGRALQAPALKTWAGMAGNAAAAQDALLLRARCNSAARFGRDGDEGRMRRLGRIGRIGRLGRLRRKDVMAAALRPLRGLH